jgi:hypothetical protein
MIDITKPVRTISGEPVTIISDKGRGHYPLLGYVGDSDQLRSWMLDGAWSNVSSSSSIENYEPQPEEWAAEKAAFAEGKAIQYRGVSGEWRDTTWPAWIDPWEYRIKPEPQWVPLEPSDAPPLSVFRHNTADHDCWCMPSEVNHYGVTFWSYDCDGGGSHLFITWDEMMEYQIKRLNQDWQPCKKEVQL